jgi:acyl dehydratase
MNAGLRTFESFVVGREEELGPLAPGQATFDRLMALTAEAFPVHADDAFAALTPVRRRLVSGLVVHTLTEAHVRAARGAPDGDLIEAKLEYLKPVHPDAAFVVRDMITKTSIEDGTWGAVEITRRLDTPDGELLYRGRLTYRVRRARPTAP